MILNFKKDDDRDIFLFYEEGNRSGNTSIWIIASPVALLLAFTPTSLVLHLFFADYRPGLE
jgi:hypothetical protein